MKLKSLLLGVAAAATATTAQAADLPVAPEPVDYVMICDTYGARFYYIPGTETCLRVGGRVRTQFIVQDVTSGGAFSNRDTDGYEWKTEGYLYLDARTATEFGTLRAYAELEGQVTNGVEAFDAGNMYIQWGGLTGGYLGSQFDHYTGQVFIGVIGRNWSDTTTQQLSYTATFGDFYVTASVEDREERDNMGTGASTTDVQTLLLNGVSTAVPVGAGGARMPDFVAAIGVNQGWGAAKLSGALHQDYPNGVHNSVGFSGEDNLGWAVGGSVLFNLDMLSAGSNIYFQGMYADGALAYIGYTPVIDSIGDDKAKGYSLSAGVYFQATSTIGLALDGSYADVDGASDTVGAVTVSQNDAKRWAIDGSVVWEPVSGLQIGADAGYADQDVDGGADTDEFLFGLRMQRTF